MIDHDGYAITVHAAILGNPGNRAVRVDAPGSADDGAAAAAGNNSTAAMTVGMQEFIGFLLGSKQLHGTRRATTKVLKLATQVGGARERYAAVDTRS